MQETATAAQVVEVMRRVAVALSQMRDRLNTLDAAVGDGDLGITAFKGGQGIEQFLDESAATSAGSDIGRFLAQAGMAFNRVASSTMGALVATALMRAGREATGKSELDAPTLARMLRAADAGVQERGKARPGDKSVVDALHPAAEAFAAAVGRDESLAAAARAMLEAARSGRDAAIPLRSQIGRARWVGERTEGQPDPGTVLLVWAMEAAMQVPPSESGSTSK